MRLQNTLASIFLGGKIIYFNYPAMIDGETMEEQWGFETEEEAKTVFDNINKLDGFIEV